MTCWSFRHLDYTNDTNILDESGDDKGVEGESTDNDGFFDHDMSKIIKYKPSNHIHLITSTHKSDVSEIMHFTTLNIQSF